MKNTTLLRRKKRNYLLFDDFSIEQISYAWTSRLILVESQRVINYSYQYFELYRCLRMALIQNYHFTTKSSEKHCLMEIKIKNLYLKKNLYVQHELLPN